MGKHPANTITVPTPIHVGDSFSATFTTDRKNIYPWAHLYVPGDPFGEWRADQGDGTIGVFELLDLPAGTACVIDLVDTRPVVLATATFTVQA